MDLGFLKVEKQFNFGHQEDKITRIKRHLTHKHLRLGSLDKKFSQQLDKKLKCAVENNEPIHLVLAIGGFKNANISPEGNINWAEVFQIFHLLNFIAKICVFYSPGIIAEYTGDAEVACIVNNYKIEWIEKYTKEFRLIINIVGSLYKKPNLQIRYTTAQDFYDISTLEKEIRLGAKRLNKASISVSEFKSASNNYFGDKTVENIERSVLLNKAWLSFDVKERAEYLEGGNRIPMLHKKGVPGVYPLRSVKASGIQFWGALGVLVDHKGKIYPSLLSYNQMLEFEKSLKYVDICKCLPKTIVNKFMDIQNLRKVPVKNF